MTVNDRPDQALLLSVSALARRRGRDKALVSRQVGKLVADGKLTTYPGARRGEKLVNFVEFERALGAVSDPVKEHAAATARLFREELPLAEPEPTAAANTSVAELQRRKLTIEAELRKLDLAERRGEMVPIAAIMVTLREIADSIVPLFDRLPLRAGEIAAAARDGEVAVRTLLKTIAYEMRARAAEVWKKIEAEGLAEEAAGPLTIEVADDASPPSCN